MTEIVSGDVRTAKKSSSDNRPRRRRPACPARACSRIAVSAPLIRVEGLAKDYVMGSKRGACPARRHARHRGRRIRRRHGALGFRQIHLHEPARLPRSSERRQLLARRPGSLCAFWRRTGGGTQSQARLRLSALQSAVRAPPALDNVALPLRYGNVPAAERPPAGRTAPVPDRPGGAHGPSPGATFGRPSSSASRLPAPWSMIRNWCSPTSRPARLDFAIPSVEIMALLQQLQPPRASPSCW